MIHTSGTRLLHSTKYSDFLINVTRFHVGFNTLHMQHLPFNFHLFIHSLIHLYLFKWSFLIMTVHHSVILCHPLSWILESFLTSPECEMKTLIYYYALCAVLREEQSNGWHRAEVIRLEQDIFTALAGQGKLYVYKTDRFWSQIKSAGLVLDICCIIRLMHWLYSL